VQGPKTELLKSSGQFRVSRDTDVLPESQIATEFIDIHTHLFSPSFGKLDLWGIDELLTYYYLEAELLRSSDIRPAQYWELSKREQADIIWRTLFVENIPVSEATRGVIAVLNAFHLPTNHSDLAEARSFFEAQTVEEHIERVLQMAGISTVVMTNDPFARSAFLEKPFFAARSSRPCKIEKRHWFQSLLNIPAASPRY
jgi:hypothetical protein